jgi:conjugal transfer pilus assembly protein TraW
MKRFKSSPIKGVIEIGVLVLCLFMNKGNVQAKDLGRVGPVYPIIEESLTLPKNGNDRQPNPLGPMTLPTASVETKQFLDLTYTVPWEIADAEGNIVYPKGYRYNPLTNRRFRTMIIIDGSKPKQLDWAEHREGATDPMTRIVITQGDLAAVSRRFKRRIYRLHPQVAERFGIETVPTIVQQKGAVLAVTSTPVH